MTVTEVDLDSDAELESDTEILVLIQSIRYVNSLSYYCYDCPFLAYFFSFFLVPLCFSLVPLLVKCSIPIIDISLTLLYPHAFRSNCSSLEYSLQNIPLYY